MMDRRKVSQIVSRWETSKKLESVQSPFENFKQKRHRSYYRIEWNRMQTYRSTERTSSLPLPLPLLLLLTSPLRLLQEPPGPYSASPLTESTITLDRSRRFWISTNDEMRSSFVASVVVSNRKPSPFPSLLLILITTISFRCWLILLWVKAVYSIVLYLKDRQTE